MSVIKRAACEALKTYLTAQSSLAGVTVTTPQRDYEDTQAYPSVSIVPRRFELVERFQEHEADDSVTGKLLVNVGTLEGTVEVRVHTRTPYERETLEEAVLAAMFSTELAPGVVVCQLAAVTVGGQAYTHQPLTTFVLSDEEWREEAAFVDDRYTFLTLDASFPLLVSRDVPSIDQLILAFTSDLTSTNPVLDESVQVNQDGSLTAVP